ncbi:glycosyltransferase [Salinibacter ruber]|uniref:glycosyltransferase n=1 Tax=Salinibacter ruber TaxID=146919 RepID=UPI002169CD1D|nr:glycosyltransferase [Salinibacter ruber]MCS4150737.1 glycosyltransferase involved in cell wall biosynthesis [Salinibacter ruber]
MFSYVPKVLYLVSKDIPTSIPLEVAESMYGKSVNINVLSFYKQEGKFSNNVNIQVHPVGASSMLDMNGIFSLGEWMYEYQPDVVHVHHTASSFWGAIMAKGLTGAAVIRTEHNNQRHYTAIQSVVHGCAQALANRILCNSKDTYENLYPFQKRLVGDNWEVVYNGVNIDRIEEASSRSSTFSEEIPLDRTLVGSVGRLVDQKNYSRLIQAFSLIAEENSGLHLVLVGDGEKRGELESKAESEDIDDRITFTGELPRDDVYAALHRFDLFVMPSLWEGFCNAVVEAMTAGNPVVSADISTLREVVGGVAKYVDPKDPDDIANGILELVREDQQKRWHREREGRRRAMQNYSIERTAEAYIRNYYQAIGQPAPVGNSSN